MEVYAKDTSTMEEMVAKLTAAHIPHIVRPKSNSAFPSLQSSESEHIIHIAAEYEVQAAHVLGIAPPVRYEPSQRKSRRWTWLLGLYAIVSSVLVLMFWYRSRAQEYSKNFNSGWDGFSTDWYMEDNRTGDIVLRSFDDNYDYNEELILDYYPGERIATRTEDPNEDGYPERVTYYDISGEISGYLIDSDLNTLSDILMWFLENGDTLKLIDTDGNGRFELAH